MAHSIVVDSRTGNTRMLAEALAVSLGGEVAAVADVSAADVSSVVLFGFWCDKGDCTPEAAAFLEGLSGRRVFLFGTAGFGGSPEYFERILGNVRAHLPKDAEVLGGAMCQGQMGEGIRRRYEAMLAENPDDARARAMLENFNAALGHPDDEDVRRIVAATRTALA